DEWDPVVALLYGHGPPEAVVALEADGLPDLRWLAAGQRAPADVDRILVLAFHQRFGDRAVIGEADLVEALLFGMPGHDAMIALVLLVAVLDECPGDQDFLAEAPFVHAARLQRIAAGPLSVDVPFAGKAVQEGELAV